MNPTVAARTGGTRWWIAAAMALGLASGTPAVAQTDPSGATASGYAYGDFVIGCTTCGHYLLQLSGHPMPYAGGPGAALAEVDYSGTPLRLPSDPLYTPVPNDYTLGGSVGLAARASFEGVLRTPVLQAQAWSDNVPAYLIADPDVPVGIDLYHASAQADTVMRYQYTGSGTAHYTFHFLVDGSVSDDLASVYASARLYADADTGFETGLIDADGASQQGPAPGTPAVFALPFSVSVDVDAGGSFYLLASLSASTAIDYRSGPVSADAFHTLRITGIDGDTSLLLAAPVPEPASGAVLLLGLSALGWRLRRTR